MVHDIMHYQIFIFLSLEDIKHAYNLKSLMREPKNLEDTIEKTNKTEEF